MFRLRKKKTEQTPLDDLVTGVLEKMQTIGPDSDDYPEMLSYLERLTSLKEKTSRERVSSDTMAVIYGNLAGILLIVAYEQKHVMTSKAFPLTLKPKQA